MQTCNRIYYSKVFLKARHVSSGTPIIIRSSKLYLQPLIYMSMWWPAVVILDNGRSPHAYVNQRLQIHLELLMMRVMPLETCWAFNERWNNKFYYKVASCWLFLQSWILLLLRVYSRYKLVNKAKFLHNFSYYVYFISVRVSGDYIPIVRRNNCIYATLGTCYSVWITVWYAAWNETYKLN